MILSRGFSNGERCKLRIHSLTTHRSQSTMQFRESERAAIQVREFVRVLGFVGLFHIYLQVVFPPMRAVSNGNGTNSIVSSNP